MKTRWNLGAARRDMFNAAWENWLLWLKDPSQFEGKPTILPEELEKINHLLTCRFGTRGLCGLKVPKTSDILLVKQILKSLGDIEEKVIKDPQRRPWNVSCFEHAVQVGTVARVMGEQLGLDSKGLEIMVMGLVHDIGRYASHHPWIHGLAGSNLLSLLGFELVYTEKAYYHLEAGAPLVGATPENWNKVLRFLSLKREISSLSLQSIIIAIADMSNTAVEDPLGSGKFVNKVGDPMIGVFNSGLRRLTQEQKEAVKGIDPLKIKREDLSGLTQFDKKMAMYLGLAWLFKDFLIQKGVVFEGEDGVVAKARQLLGQ